MSGVRPASLSLLFVFSLLVASCGSGPQDKRELTAAEIAAQASQKVQELNSLHFKLESQGGPTPIGGGFGLETAEGDMVKPDKIKVTVRASFLGQALELGFISLGADSFMTNPLTGKWAATPAGISPIGFFDPKSGAASVLDGMKNAEKLENEAIDGAATYHLRGLVPTSTLKAMAGSGVEEGEVKAEVWVRVEDLLPAQFRLEGTLMVGEQPNIVRLLRLSRFDQPATIEAPR